MEGVDHDRASNLGTRTGKLDRDSHRTNDLPGGDFPWLERCKLWKKKMTHVNIVLKEIVYLY